MADVEISQYDLVTLTESSVALEVSQLGLEVVFNVPSDQADASQLDIAVVTTEAALMDVSQYDMDVVYRGRVEDPNLRAWRFWLDGRWHYVLRLPTGITLVYDLLAQQWYIWGSGSSPLWRAFHGINWLGAGNFQGEVGSNVVTTDDGNGAIYMLDPEGYVDDDAIEGAAIPRVYLREATGQIVTRSRDAVPCYGVSLMGAIGEVDETLTTTVSLATSDDEGHAWQDHGALLVPPGEYSTRLDWLSLGSIEAPGRLFKIADYGVLQRLDWLEMVGDDDGSN